RAPGSSLAVHHDLRIAVEGGYGLRERGERDEPRACYPRYLPLVRLAHVEQERRIGALEPFAQLGGGDGGDLVVGMRVAPSTNPAEALVVDEFAQLTRAARRAGGIAAESHG